MLLVLVLVLVTSLDEVAPTVALVADTSRESVQSMVMKRNMLVKSCRELINEELAEGISEIESRSRRGDDYDYEIIGGGGGDSFGREDDVGEENIGDEEDDSSNEFEYDPGIDDLL